MDDLISRHEAIEAVFESAVGKQMLSGHKDLITILMNLPSAEPEQKTGRWMPQDMNKSNGMISTAVYYYPKCSVCGCASNYTNFCPNCGAKME